MAVSAKFNRKSLGQQTQGFKRQLKRRQAYCCNRRTRKNGPPDGIEAAIASFRAALSDPARQGTIQYAPYSFALFSEVLCLTGNHDGGSDALRDAAVIAKQSGERWWDAEIFRLRGLVALSGGEVSESEAWLLKSLQTAQQQRAKSLELRAAMSLARLWRDQGKVQQARELLAPVYGWFTEGFDTLDLKEAKALLDELHA